MKYILSTILSIYSILLFGQNGNIRFRNYYDSKFEIGYYLTWDINTGKSAQYYWGDGAWQPMENNLPAQPLEGVVIGKVYMSVYYDPKFEAAYYVVWDTKTGRSLQYYWSEGAWKKMPINLPENPLKDVVGEVMIEPYFDTKYGGAYYLVYDTANGNTMQYYWSDSAWKPMSINLPSNPVGN